MFCCKDNLKKGRHVSSQMSGSDDLIWYLTCFAVALLFTLPVWGKWLTKERPLLYIDNITVYGNMFSGWLFWITFLCAVALISTHFLRRKNEEIR